MTHNELWGGIENLAKAHNITCSRLARISGLDATAFNVSRHKSKYGQERWPTMLTISRVLDSTGITLAEFATYMPSDTHIRPKSQYLINRQQFKERH
jgi:phage repressor protein C with HTH and peptisase S24 domain